MSRATVKLGHKAGGMHTILQVWYLYLMYIRYFEINMIQSRRHCHRAVIGFQVLKPAMSLVQINPLEERYKIVLITY